VVAYSVAVPQTHSQFTLIFTLPNVPMGAFFFLGFVFGLGFGFWTEGHDCFLQSCGCAIEVMVAERLVRGWMRDEVCGGVCRGEARICEGICGVGIS
jgi:hypothetical protein